MKTFASCALATAVALAFSVSAHAANTNGMTHASKSATLAQCASMTGKDRTACIKEHKASGKTASTGRADTSNMRMRNNDKSGSGSGSVGGSTGPAGTAGSTGAGATGGTGAGAAGAGGNGGGPGK